MNPSPKCPVCDESMNPGLSEWHFICSRCAYESSLLLPAINTQRSVLDENARELALSALRKDNFKRLLLQLKKAHGDKPGRLLDVGAAHGWFLEAAENDFSVLGIEPDEAMLTAAAAREKNIRPGFFPDALAAHEKFEIMVFNDVFEHLPEVQQIIAACHRHIVADGLLLLNLPGSTGIFYRIAKVLKRLGVNVFFDRLWQKDMPSPHLHYFSADNLELLLARNGFTEISRGTLPSIELRGLFSRIAYGAPDKPLFNVMIFFALLFAYPIIRLFPDDTIYLIFRKVE